MHLVKHAEYVSEYRLLLTFEDGEVRLVNLKPHLDGEVFQPLKDLDYFKLFQADLELDTVVWPNGADFSPDFLYEIGQPLTDSTLAADH